MRRVITWRTAPWIIRRKYAPIRPIKRSRTGDGGTDAPKTPDAGVCSGITSECADPDTLRTCLGAGMVAPPHAMVPGTTEKDYYLGKVTQAVPEQETTA